MEESPQLPPPEPLVIEFPPIRVFPNSGHHLTFLPFDETFLRTNPDIKQRCDAESSEWKAFPNIHWVRRQFGKKNGELGLWLAVESNLGHINRSWVFEPETLIDRKATLDPAAVAAATPYAFSEPEQLPAEPQEIELEIRDDKNEKLLKARLLISIIWLRPIADPIDVDLIVDFGNTRTVVLALEHNSAAEGSLNAICHPVRFIKRAEEYGPFDEQNDPAAIIDSWFILQETLFANLEPNDRAAESGGSPVVFKAIRYEEEKKLFRATQRVPVGVTKRVPQMFVEMSPAQIGPGAADSLAHLDLRRGGNCFMSSPKRYLWDTDRVGNLAESGATQWTMNLNRWHPQFEDAAKGRIGLRKLSCTALRFLEEDGKDWSLGEDGNSIPPNERTEAAHRPFPDPDAPRYPRADSLTWVGLSVLECSYRQITSQRWRERLGQPDTPRRIRSVTVTFPPGWSSHELDLYRRKWQKAIDIFSLTRLPGRQLIGNGGDRPRLLMEIDEATASQLPFVFGEMRQFRNEGENWIGLVGRGTGSTARVRVLNIDIGGGTTDVGIVEYSDLLEGPGVDLNAELLFRDSSTIAGDYLIKSIIEAVLLPAIATKISGKEARRERQKFDKLMYSEKQNERVLWNRITLQVFIPIVRWWLSHLSSEEGSAKTGSKPNEMVGTDGPLIQADVLGTDEKAPNYGQSFNGLCKRAGLPSNLLSWNDSLHYDMSALLRCIDETFAGLFRSISNLVEAFDCDLVLVSGKPSELPRVREILNRELPIALQRIVFTKGADVGSWYPLSVDGVIHDAKTVTAAGAALYRAIKVGLVPQWKITRTVSPKLLQRNYWGLMPGGAERDFGKILLKPNDVEVDCELTIKARIGRRFMPSESRPEPVYQLHWRDRTRYQGNKGTVIERLKIRLKREDGEAIDGHPAAETLRIADISGDYNGTPVSLDDVELKLCTMDSEEHWMDKGTFSVQWNDQIV